jgi:hypothetical protein
MNIRNQYPQHIKPVGADQCVCPNIGIKFPIYCLFGLKSSTPNFAKYLIKNQITVHL